MNAAQAFIAFLRCEAFQSEERARSLRSTAAAIEANNIASRKKKRKHDTGKPKKGHTAYTLFVHENYEEIKKGNEELSSRDIIAMVASRWSQTSEDERQAWKYRAETINENEGLNVGENANNDSSPNNNKGDLNQNANKKAKMTTTTTTTTTTANNSTVKDTI